MRREVVDPVSAPAPFLRFRFSHFLFPESNAFPDLFQAGAGQDHLLDLLALPGRYGSLSFQPHIKVPLGGLF